MCSSDLGVELRQSGDAEVVEEVLALFCKEALGWAAGKVVEGFRAATTKTAEVATATTAAASW